MIRVLIADDHTVVRKGFQSLLSSKKYGIKVVGEAENGEQAIKLALELQPDVVLMDMQMPKMSGLEAITEILDQQPNQRILVLTSFGEEERVSAAMRAGAFGYLLKDSSPDELVSAIHAVASGHISLPQKLSGALFSRQIEEHVAPDHSVENELTERELDVLRCLAEGASNKEIANQLSIGMTTVRTHVSNILRKLDLENRTQAAIYAREQDLE